MSKLLIPIIAMVSVAVMIIWGTVGNAWNISWLAVFVGGIAMAIVSMFLGAKEKAGKDNNKEGKDNKDKNDK